MSPILRRLIDINLTINFVQMDYCLNCTLLHKHNRGVAMNRTNQFISMVTLTVLVFIISLHRRLCSDAIKMESFVVYKIQSSKSEFLSTNFRESQTRIPGGGTFCSLELFALPVWFYSLPHLRGRK